MPAYEAKQFHRQNIGLLLCVLLHAAFTCALALTRLYTYKTSVLDLGTFDQLLWNSIHHGTFISTTNPPFHPQPWFGFHFSPILLLITPLYALWPHAELLQILQSLCFAFTGFVLFHAAVAAGAKQREAWVVSAFYWLNPFVISGAIWDFHEIALAAPCISIALWALCRGRFLAMVCSLSLLLLTKEHYGLTVAGFGVLWGWHHRDWRRGGMVMLLGIVSTLFIVGYLMPHIGGNAHHPMLDENNTHNNRYAWLSTPWRGKIDFFYSLMFEKGTANAPGIFYIFILLLSGLLLPLAAPVWLLPAAADLAANLLSSNPMQRHIGAYHSAAMLPVILLAAWQGYHHLRKKRYMSDTLLHTAMLAQLVVLVVSGLAVLPLKIWELDRIVLTPDPAVARIRTLLPPGPLSVQQNVGAFFSERPLIYPFPMNLQDCDAALLRIENPFHDSQTRFNIGISAQEALYMKQLLHLPGWHIAYWQAPWLLMEHTPATKDERILRADIEKHIATIKTAP